MANPTFFYNSTIFNYSVALANSFSNLSFYKLNTSGAPVGDPNEFSITFGPIDSIYAQRKADLSETNEKYYQPVLKGGLVLDDFSFAKDRTMGSNENLNLWNPTSAITSLDEFYKEINPTPFDFHYTLQIKSTKFEYATQILEQIAPYFYPQQNIRVRELSYLNLERDIKIVIDEFPFDFSKVLEYDEKREINIDIPITLEGFLYRPLSTEKIVKYIQTEYRLLEYDGYNIAGNYNLSASL